MWIERRAPPSPETRFVNFDPETTNPQTLTAGWSGFEHNARQDTWVWCAAKHCTMVVDTSAPRERLLRMRMWAFRYSGAPKQSIAVKLIGSVIGTIELEDEPLVWSLRVAKGAWRDGKNLLRFDFEYAAIPGEHVPNSSDARTLSVAFDWLEIVPL